MATLKGYLVLLRYGKYLQLDSAVQEFKDSTAVDMETSALTDPDLLELEYFSDEDLYIAVCIMFICCPVSVSIMSLCILCLLDVYYSWVFSASLCTVYMYMLRCVNTDLYTCEQQHNYEYDNYIYNILYIQRLEKVPTQP